MNQLKVISINGQLVTDSREVAEMVAVQHKHLLADIRKYSEILHGRDLGSEKFFIESTYLNSRNQIQPCYLLTRVGCDMVANKMTGEKGVLFTAAYVTRFEELEKAANTPKPLTEKEQLRATLRLSLETSEEVEVLKEDVAELKDKVENQITLDHGEQRGLQKAVARKVYELEVHEQLRPKLFREIYREIKDRFGVASYKDVKRKDLQAAVNYVNAWIPRKVS